MQTLPQDLHTHPPTHTSSLNNVGMWSPCLSPPVTCPFHCPGPQIPKAGRLAQGHGIFRKRSQFLLHKGSRKGRGFHSLPGDATGHPALLGTQGRRGLLGGEGRGGTCLAQTFSASQVSLGPGQGCLQPALPLCWAGGLQSKLHPRGLGWEARELRFCEGTTTSLRWEHAQMQVTLGSDLKPQTTPHK